MITFESFEKTRGNILGQLPYLQLPYLSSYKAHVTQAKLFTLECDLMQELCS